MRAPVSPARCRSAASGFTYFRGGFGLISLLVILAILLLLLGLALPLVQRMRTAATGTQSINNLRQLALAMHNMNDTYNKMPPVVGSFPQVDKDKTGTLFSHALPFLGQGKLPPRQLDSKYAPYNVRMPLFISQEDNTAPPGNMYQGWLATSNYAANWMVFGSTDGGTASIPASFPDGTSNTLIFTERYQICRDTPCAWGYAALYYWAPMFGYYSKGKFQHLPTQKECDPALPQSLDWAGIHVALGDGSARTISDLVSPRTWWLVTDPADGMVIPDDWNN